MPIVDIFIHINTRNILPYYLSHEPLLRQIDTSHLLYHNNPLTPPLLDTPELLIH